MVMQSKDNGLSYYKFDFFCVRVKPAYILDGCLLKCHPGMYWHKCPALFICILHGQQYLLKIDRKVKNRVELQSWNPYIAERGRGMHSTNMISLKFQKKITFTLIQIHVIRQPGAENVVISRVVRAKSRPVSLLQQGTRTLKITFFLNCF